MLTSSTQPVSEQELLRIELPEARYKADLMLFDHGRNLSAELLKLSLAAIAVVGALLTVPSKGWPDDLLFKMLVASAVVVFALSIGLALLQRFFASSAMFHHMKAMKMAFLNNTALASAIEAEIAIRLKQFTRAHRLLVGTALFLALGAIFLGGAFIRLLFVP